MYLPSFPVQGVIPGFTFPLSTVGRLGYITSPPTQSQFSHRDPRYYVPLRPPLSIPLGSLSLPPGTLHASFLFVSPFWGLMPSVEARPACRVLVMPASPSSRLSLQGDSRLSQVRELPLYAHAPVSDPGGVPHACHCALGTAAFQTVNYCRLSPPTRIILSDHHIASFGIQCRGLRTRFPSASHTPSQGSHFGSATRLLAML